MFRWASALFICFAIPSLACALDPRAAFERGDYVSASEEWKRLAEKGDPKAQHNLGLLFDQGLGVEQDYEQAGTDVRILCHTWYGRRHTARRSQPVYADRQGRCTRRFFDARALFIRRTRLPLDV